MRHGLLNRIYSKSVVRIEQQKRLLSRANILKCDQSLISCRIEHLSGDYWTVQALRGFLVCHFCELMAPPFQTCEVEHDLLKCLPVRALPFVAWTGL